MHMEFRARKEGQGLAQQRLPWFLQRSKMTLLQECLVTASQCDLKHVRDVGWLGVCVVGAGHGESFWLLRVFDTDRSIMESLGNVAGGFGKEGCKARALAMLAQRLKGSRGSMAREREGTLSEGQTASSGKDSAVSLTPEGWSGPEQEGEDIMEAILGTSKDSIYERFLHDRLPLPSWIGASGRVVLLGDGEGTAQIFCFSSCSSCHGLLLFATQVLHPRSIPGKSAHG